MANKYVRSSHTVSMASLFHCICEKKILTVYKEPTKTTQMYLKLISFLIKINAFPHIPGCLWKYLVTFVSPLCSAQ